LWDNNASATEAKLTEEAESGSVDESAGVDMLMMLRVA
jgi:hypothetical protein